MKKLILLFSIIILIILLVSIVLYLIPGDQHRNLIQDIRFIRDYIQTIPPASINAF